MIRIGIIGIGFMGYTHFEGARKLKGAKVTAIATRNAKKRAGDWTGIQGNFGPRGGHVDLSKIKTYHDYQELIADPDIDLVDICLPTDLHEKVTREALSAGKHVLVEKPIALDLKAANRMVAAAKKSGTMLMVGQVLPFFPEFRFAAETLASGKYGKLLAAHFRRVIAPPNWSKDISDYRRLGGWGVDLHIHDNHFISLLCGVPQKVFSRGILQDGLVNHVHTQYVYDDPNVAISCVSGGIAASGLQFVHGFEIYLEKATLLFDAGTFGGEWVVDRPLSLINNRGKVTHPKLKGGTEWYAAFTAELQTAVDGIRSGKEPKILSGILARDALKLCFAEAKSISDRRVVRV
ncbi:MAG: Gfo/Idh/MocA family oxidoreductase [Planctomycetes bacterium]|nr:Gfo/Idh/MocA family oxidoreductase [Planctomycetota bacterium]